MAQSQDFERLKQKYQSAIHLMEQLQVHLQNINMEGNKLFIRGEAPSEEAKNKAWDQVKLIDPTYSDLTLDLTVSAQQAPSQSTAQQTSPQSATMTAGASASGGQNQRHYTVQPGDTLSKISRQFYGDANKYMKIYEANRGTLHDPNKIGVGQELIIPE